VEIDSSGARYRKDGDVDNGFSATRSGSPTKTNRILTHVQSCHINILLKKKKGQKEGSGYGQKHLRGW
jgi:hypothetical protein